MQMATPSSESPADHDYLSKLLLIGDSGVGKSCLLQRFCDDSFTASSVNTIGIDFKLRTIEIDGKRIKLHLLDTAGQQRFQPITTTYYEGAMGVLLVYDVTDKTSFLNTRKWMDKFHKHTHNDAQLILIGNKADGHDYRRVVPRSRGQALAEEYGIKFWETSSKSNVNVEEVFFTISKDILQSAMEKAKGERLLREKALKRPIFSNINESSEGSSGKAQADSSTTTLPKVEQDTNMDSKINLLVNTLRNGTLIEKKDAVTDLSDCSTVHENRVKIVQFGAVTHLVQLMDPSVGMVEEAIAVLANLAKIPEGRNEICVWGGIPVMVDIVELGSEVEKEYAIEALLKLCLHSNRVCNLVIRRKVIPPLFNCTLSGTLRAKQNARALLEYLKIKRFDLNTQVNMKHPAGNIHFQHGNGNSNFLWPSPYLLARENRRLYLSIGVPLYNASLCGDWETAKIIIFGNYTIPRTLLCCCITKQYETTLHVASGARQVAFVEELLKMMKPKDLTLQDRMGNTALSLAVAAGTVPIAKMLIEKNSSLLYIPSSANITPLYIAAAFGHHGMAWFIYNQIRDHIRNLEGIFFRCIDTCLFGLALELLRKDSSLAVARNEYNETALHVLSRKPSVFVRKNPGTLKGLRKLINSYNRCGDNTDSVPNIALQLVTCLWKEILKDQHLDIGETINSPFGLLFEAARMGNHTFLIELIRCYPDLIWEVNNMNQTIFHVAVLHRHASIFNQIHKIGSIKDEIVAYDSDQGDNILHLAAKKPSTDRLNTVSGAALQMHQELMWFKEVKSITPLLLREKIGSEGLTPRELFIKEHKDLLKDGEKWMKNTARSCMIVATLITTVVFAAAFSVPGGNNNFGTPIRVNAPLFHVFAISDAMALSSSIISSLMFLYILTSRYAEEDFLDSLPFKLMVGLATLFISMVTMMVAFMAAFFIAYHHHKLRWVPFLSSSFLSVPVTLFVMLQSPLFRDIFRAACSTSPFRPSGSGSKQAGAMIPLAGANLHSPPQAKF